MVIASRAVGRRKRAVAQVELLPDGQGKILVNNRDILEYMQLNLKTVSNIQDPLEVLGLENKYDAIIKVSGGGIIGQAQAIRLGIARALCKVEDYELTADNKKSDLARPEVKDALKIKGFLTQDSRRKERKKYGLRKARKAPQYSKR